MTGTWLRGLLPPATVSEVRQALATARFVSGRQTAHGAARAAKDNLQLAADDPLARELNARLAAALSASDLFRTVAMPRVLVPFTFARYDPGMTYGDHVDLPVMGTSLGPVRTDLSLTIFLSDPSDYDGGELSIDVGHGLDGVPATTMIKGDAGDGYLYSAAHIHRVTPVSRGQRLVALTWAQSLVADAEEREILAALALTLGTLASEGVPEASLLPLRAIQNRLSRRWVR